MPNNWLKQRQKIVSKKKFQKTNQFQKIWAVSLKTSSYAQLLDFGMHSQTYHRTERTTI